MSIYERCCKGVYTLEEEVNIHVCRQEYLSNRISFGYWRDVELYRRPKPSNMLLWMMIESLGRRDIDVLEVVLLSRAGIFTH